MIRGWWFVALVVLVFGAYLAGRTDGVKAERERMNELVQKEQINHAKQLSKANDSLVVASKEYDCVKSERDRLALKLRRATSTNGQGFADGACATRVARLEAMVNGLHELVERCDSGWHGCAARKDALVEAVK